MGRRPVRYQFRGQEEERHDPERLERALQAWLLALLRGDEDDRGQTGGAPEGEGQTG